MDKFESLIRSLESRLKEPLPGLQGQMDMAPVSRKSGRYQIKSNNARKSAVLILLYPKDGNICFPLIKRPDYDGVHSGQIAFPGGKVEKEDKNIVETALRETHEEIGVKVGEEDVIGQLTDLYISPSNFLVTPVVSFLTEEPAFMPDKVEVEEVVVASLDVISNSATRKEKEIVINNKYKLNAPYFDIQGHVVWGATAMMLSELLHISREMMH